MKAPTSAEILTWYGTQPEPFKDELKAKARATATASGKTFNECIKKEMRTAELKSRLKCVEGKYKLKCDETQFSLCEVVNPTEATLAKNPDATPRDVPFAYWGSLAHAVDGVQRFLEREMLMPIPELNTPVIIAAIKQSQNETLKIVKEMLECQKSKK